MGLNLVRYDFEITFLKLVLYLIECVVTPGITKLGFHKVEHDLNPNLFVGFAITRSAVYTFKKI